MLSGMVGSTFSYLFDLIVFLYNFFSVVCFRINERHIRTNLIPYPWIPTWNQDLLISWAIPTDVRLMVVDMVQYIFRFVLLTHWYMRWYNHKWMIIFMGKTAKVQKQLENGLLTSNPIHSICQQVLKTIALIFTDKKEYFDMHVCTRTFTFCEKHRFLIYRSWKNGFLVK